jgi:DNA-binding GntR family transcriptional regulator
MVYATATPLVKRTVNGLLELVSAQGFEQFPTEAELAKQLGVSRTPLRSAMQILVERGVFALGDSGVEIARKPKRSDYFPMRALTRSPRETAEAFLLAKLSSGGFAPGQPVNELALARDAGVHAATMGDALYELARYGLIEKEPRRQWRVRRLDDAAVDQLFDYRELLEVWAVKRACRLPDDSAVRKELQLIFEAHKQANRSQAKVTLDEFRVLDLRFHRALFEALDNRFALDSFRMISLLIHFQLQQTAVGLTGMQLGLREHTDLLKAILAGDSEEALRCVRKHLGSARAVTKRAVAEAG